MPELPNMANGCGTPALVPMMFFMSPLAQLASILMSSPAPHGMFLICKAIITEPPHLSVGWPEISERLFGDAAARPVAPAGAAVANTAVAPPTPVSGFIKLE